MLYIQRRTALVGAIRQRLSDKLTVIRAEAGMHLVALLSRAVSDVAISLRPAEVGVSAMPLSSCYAKPPPVGGLILGYGGTDAPPSCVWAVRLPPRLLATTQPYFVLYLLRKKITPPKVQ